MVIYIVTEVNLENEILEHQICQKKERKIYKMIKLKINKYNEKIKK